MFAGSDSRLPAQIGISKAHSDRHSGRHSARPPKVCCGARVFGLTGWVCVGLG